MTKSNRGGARPGAGHKPNLLTQLLLDTRTAKGDIRAAYKLFRETMRDESLALVVRLDAAREVLNRLCGKPAQALQVSGDGGGPVRIVVEYAERFDGDDDAPPDFAEAPPGPAGDPAGDAPL